jgi:aspartyl-tRNA(Asn)/glutamyl-tRNA(Gln) amidotransferase subunit A
MSPFATLTELGAALAAGTFSAEALAAACLDRIAAAETLHAFIAVEAEAVLDQARASDLRRRAGHALGPLDGLPIALKDLFEIEGGVTSNGSLTRPGGVSRVTAAAVRRLRAAGMVILGRAQMVEFAYGGWGINPQHGTPRNPWDLARHRIPGGSSSGSGVAVAGGLVPAALGSDTGGSIRIPASLVGITGVKTTVGLISRAGALPLSPSCDSIGPMTRSVADAALLTTALAGPDPRDAATLGAPTPDYAAAMAAGGDLRGVRIAVLPEEDFPVPVHPAVAAAYAEAQRVLAALGAQLSARAFPVDLAELLQRNGQLIGAEVWATHRAVVTDEAQPVGAWVRRRIAGGAAISAAEYIEALAHHRAATATWREAMAGTAAFLMPAVPIPACQLDEVDEDSPILSAFTRPANHLGACAIALPAGFAADGMPVAVQLMAKPFDEAALFRIGHAFQCATDWHCRTPPAAAVA